MQPERIARYLPAADKKKDVALQYYLWNCALCEGFFFSLHMAEIVSRNALHNGLMKRCGDDLWYKHTTFLGLLGERFKNELTEALDREREQHGKRLTSHHLVSALTFGFWEHLTTKRFERFLWAKGVRNIFPCAPKDAERHDLNILIESVRRWRNRIAHHRAIFDKNPMRKHQDALELISFVCSDTYTWVAASSCVPAALGLRPTKNQR